MPIWERRVAPLFDTAAQLLLVDVDGATESRRTTVPLPEHLPAQRVRRLSELGAGVLICGGISRPLAVLVMAAGVQVVPWVAGPVDQVLQAYERGKLPNPAFVMPGCWGHRRRCGWRGGRPGVGPFMPGVGGQGGWPQW
jgi:predicted Fe-Mo cluster-binding NifX family protein